VIVACGRFRIFFEFFELALSNKPEFSLFKPQNQNFEKFKKNRKYRQKIEIERTSKIEQL